MVGESGVSMFHGYIPIYWISREDRGLEQHLQIHHIVDDHREFPFVGIMIP